MDPISLEEEAAATGEPDWDEADRWDDHHAWLDDGEEHEPDWVPRWRHLVERAGRVFVAPGEMAHAAEAYRRLFAVAVEAVEQGWSLTTIDQEDDPVDEAAARYLRSQWEASEGPQRLGEAVTMIDDGLLTSGAVSLAAVAGAGSTPPEDMAAFLDEWIVALSPLTDDADVGQPWAHRLLVEAVATRHGSEGLAVLARAGGPHSGSAYLAWFDAAWGKDDLAEARLAALEGMAGTSAAGDRAALAERLAALGEDALSDAQSPGMGLSLASRVVLLVLARLDDAVALAEDPGATGASRHAHFDTLAGRHDPTGRPSHRPVPQELLRRPRPGGERVRHRLRRGHRPGPRPGRR